MTEEVQQTTQASGESPDTQKAIDSAVSKLKTAADSAKELADEAMEAAKKIQEMVKEILEFKENAIKIATDMIKQMGTAMATEIGKMISGGSPDLPGAMKKSLTDALEALGKSLPPKPPADGGSETPSSTPTT